ncbi:MAG: pitrilysin family protein [Myxococcales bacterium]
MSIFVSLEGTVKHVQARAVFRSVVALLALLGPLGGCGGINVVHKQKLELKPVGLPLRTFAFNSGLRVIVERDTRTSLAGVFVVVGSGSSSDPAGKEGLAHYVEHLAFQSRPFGAESFAELLDKSGSIQRNAFTDFDSTTYFEIGPASALPQLLRIEAVRMVAPVSNVPAQTRVVELDVVRNELRERNETGFVGDVYSRLQAALFPAGHLYSRPIGGTHQSVSALAKVDTEAFAKAHYRPDNMTLVLVGNIDLDSADKLLAETLPEALVAAPKPVRLPARLAPSPPAVPEPPARPAALPRVEAAIASPELWIGWALPRGFDRDGYLLSFLASSARHRLSRLKLDDRDIAHIDVYPDSGKEASILRVRVALQAASAPEKTLERVLREAPRIVNAFPLEAGLQEGSRYNFAEMAYSRARRAVLIGELLEMQDLVARGLRRAAVTHFSQDPALLSRALHDLSELKAARFHEYALPYLTADRARAVLFVPKGGGMGGGPAEGPDRMAPPDRDRWTGRLAPPPRELADDLVASHAQLSTQRLKNGLSVVLARRVGLPLVTASLSLAVGPAATRDGGSLVFARAMAAPAGRLNEPSEYGGHAWSWYGQDRITETVEGSSGNAEAILATLAEQARTMRVERNDALHFREFVLPSYRWLEREPHRLAERAFLAALLPDTGYGHVPQLEEIEAASYASTTRWIEHTYSPENATLVVVGDFEPGEVQRWIDDSFGGWTANGGAPPDPHPPAAPHEARANVRILTTPRPGGTQGELRFGCRLPDVNTGPIAVRHELAARVARDRLWHTLRDTLGATYGVQVRPVELPGGTAYLDLRANVENGKLTSVLSELHAVLDQLAAAPANPDALRWARYEEASSVALNQMTNGAAASSIFQRTRFGLSPDPAEIRRDSESVSERDIQADFQFCLGTQPTLSLVGEEKVLQAALKEGWR